MRKLLGISEAALWKMKVWEILNGLLDKKTMLGNGSEDCHKDFKGSEKNERVDSAPFSKLASISSWTNTTFSDDMARQHKT